MGAETLTVMNLMFRLISFGLEKACSVDFLC